MAFEKKYSDEQRERAVARVVERRRSEPGNRAILREVAAEMGVGEQSLRIWVARQDDGVLRAAAERGAEGEAEVRAILDQSTATRRSLLVRIAQLEAEVASLREENEVLKRASSIFAAELAKR